jgi:hypothetical protein
MTRTIPLVLMALVNGTALAAQDTDSAKTGANQVLFESEDPLTLTIEAPLETIFKEREQESSYHPGAMILENADGSRSSLDIEVKTRGKFRLNRRNCGFPPLRINFKTKQVENTVFAGQDKLKLVTHCQDKRDEYQQYILLEYLVYRTYNLLTDMSFRVRLARINYVDTDEDRDPITKYAFFIEDDELMAARNGWDLLQVPVVPPVAYKQDQLNLAEVFQFLAGNTDWDAFKGPPDEIDCCHNVKVIGNPQGPVFPVPYDFDWTGMVSARYAKPDPSLSIRTVRQRLYRGVCLVRDQLSSTIPAFEQQKEAIYGLYQNQEGLEEKQIERSVDYLDDFYEIVGDPKKVERNMYDRCRGFGTS